jgi:hypothetical protein
MITVVLAAALASALDTPEPDWAALARGDIEAMHSATLDSHPGPVDLENPGFLATMEQARTRGLSLAEQAVDAPGFFYALQAYAATYRDGHYQTGPELQSAATAWPGFIAGRQSGVWRVSATDEAHTRLDGTVIESCDGRSPDEMMLENVFAFAGDPALEAQWVRFGARLFLDSGNPFVTAPHTCVFVAGDQRTEQNLDWQSITRSDWSTRVSATRDRAETGMTEFAPDSYWIGLPNFNPSHDELADVQNLIAELSARAQTLREARVLVIDVRGNNGGSSAWGNAVVDAIWGAGYAAWRQPAEANGVDYRVSDDNIDHLQVMIEQTIEQGQPAMEAEMRTVYDGMLEARDAGQGYYHQPAPAGTQSGFRARLLPHRLQLRQRLSRLC